MWVRDILALWRYECHIKRSLTQFTAVLSLHHNDTRNYCSMFVAVVFIQKWWNLHFQGLLGNKTFCHSTGSGIDCCPQILFSLVKEKMIESVQESIPRLSHCIGTTLYTPLPPLLVWLSTLWTCLWFLGLLLVLSRVVLCAVQVGRWAAGGGGGIGGRRYLMLTLFVHTPNR